MNKRLLALIIMLTVTLPAYASDYTGALIFMYTAFIALPFVIVYSILTSKRLGNGYYRSKENLKFHLGILVFINGIGVILVFFDRHSWDALNYPVGFCYIAYVSIFGGLAIREYKKENRS